MNTLQILLILSGLTSAIALIWIALAGPSPKKETARRLRQVQVRHSSNAVDRVEMQMRKAVAARKPKTQQSGSTTTRAQALALRLHQTGQSWTLKQYLLTNLGIILFVAALVFLKSGVPLLSLMLGVAVGAGIPHLVVNYLINKRATQFIVKFPDAIDLLVRGLRSGLPVSETLQIIASEVPAPVGEEFKLVTERVKIGKSMEEALQNTADRLNLAEFSFFCITLAIQRETGGNLAETLANLSEVLRKRAQMKLKIRAMSSESKASAYIVGSLPFIVFLMIWWVNSGYIGKFFEDERLMVAGAGGLIWMSIGAFIMAKMVSFEI